MIFYLRLLSNEADDFVKEIAIESEKTFGDLHEFLQQLLNYDASQMASFFTTDSDWNKELEVTLFDMGTGDIDNLLVMQETKLSELINETGQRLLYIYDFFSERAFFAEVIQISEGHLDQPNCYRNEGTAPDQILISDLENDFLTEEELYSDDEDDLGYPDWEEHDQFSNDSFNEEDYSSDY